MLIGTLTIAGPLIDKSYMNDYDMIFISETHSSGHTLLDISGFHKVVDPLFNTSKHGGIAAYIKNKIVL